MGLESDILTDLLQLLTANGVQARWQGLDLLVRLASLLIGLLVGILSLVAMVKKKCVAVDTTPRSP